MRLTGAWPRLGSQLLDSGRDGRRFLFEVTLIAFQLRDHLFARRDVSPVSAMAPMSAVLSMAAVPAVLTMAPMSVVLTMLAMAPMSAVLTVAPVPAVPAVPEPGVPGGHPVPTTRATPIAAAAAATAVIRATIHSTKHVFAPLVNLNDHAANPPATPNVVSGHV